MRRKIISDYLAVLHYEANALQLGNVSDRIPGNGDKVSEFPGLKKNRIVFISSDSPQSAKSTFINPGPQVYSWRRATSVSTRIARRAGM